MSWTLGVCYVLARCTKWGKGWKPPVSYNLPSVTGQWAEIDCRRQPSPVAVDENFMRIIAVADEDNISAGANDSTWRRTATILMLLVVVVVVAVAPSSDDDCVIVARLFINPRRRGDLCEHTKRRRRRSSISSSSRSYMPSIVSPAISVRPSTTDAVALIQSTRITSKQSRRSLGLHRPAPRDTWLTRLSQRLFRTAECVSVQSEVHYESVHRKTEVAGEDRVPVNWYERSKCVYIIHINVVAKKDGSKPRYLHCNNVYQLLFWGTVLPGATKMLQCFLFQHENRNIHVVHEYFLSPNILCLFRTYVFANLFIFIPFIWHFEKWCSNKFSVQFCCSTA